MKTLYLLRHAKSSWADSALDDIDRPLNRRGVESCGLLGRYLARHGAIPDLVLCSPARRTRETVELVAQYLDRPMKTAVHPALYLGSPAEILRAIRNADDGAKSLMVVGHNPDLGLLARSLARASAGDERARLLASKFPTAALARYEAEVASWKKFGAKVARLAAFVTPKLLT